MADAAASNIALFQALAGLPKTLFGSTQNTTETTGGGTSTSTRQSMISQAGVDALLKSLMEGTGGRAGLAQVTSGQKAPGMYNTTSRQLLVNDLLARSTAEVEKARTPEVTTKQETPTQRQQQVVTPGMMSKGTGLLGAAALALGTKKGRETIGDIFGMGGSGVTGADAFGGMDYSSLQDIQGSVSSLTDFGLTNGGGNAIDWAAGASDMGTDFITNIGSSMDWASGGFDTASMVMDQVGAFSDVAAGGFDMASSMFDLGDTTVDLASGADFLDMGGTPISPFIKLAQGDVEGAALTGIGYAVGGPVGGFIGSILGGGCFITTAVCMSGGKADDCYELQTLREFRDTWLHENHPQDIKRYYLEAPAIVSRIQGMPEAARIFNSFERDYIQPAVEAIESEQYETAYTIYKNLFNVAKEIANG